MGGGAEEHVYEHWPDGREEPVLDLDGGEQPERKALWDVQDANTDPGEDVYEEVFLGFIVSDVLHRV